MDRTTAIAAALAVLSIAGSTAARQQQKSPTDPFIGKWVINQSKSTPTAGSPARSQVRTFDYTHDGRFIHTITTVNAQGQESFTFWESKFDGTEGLEFRRPDPMPDAVLVMQRADANTITYTAKRDGKVFVNG